MKGESTYNKYKRERKELMAIVDSEIRQFCVSQKDFTNRLNFIRKMSLLYRKEQHDALSGNDGEKIR